MNGRTQWTVQVYLSEDDGGVVRAWAVLSPGDDTALVGTGQSGDNTSADSADSAAWASGSEEAAGVALCDLGRRLAGVAELAAGAP
ncbi:dsRBD fold-containing protein [Actinomadura monticuli]|uniref:DsRBD fold-containing protein n=1 Tax=Actinomadura monticuli TaxID=3097367 RepID=A0ABV4QIJ1_9ACTN